MMMGNQALAPVILSETLNVMGSFKILFGYNKMNEKKTPCK